MLNQATTLTPEQELERFGYKQELKRTMSTLELTAFGVNYMMPIAPAIMFGFILQRSGGSVTLPYLLAGACMMFTAFSYAIMVRNYPLSGSIYSYVSRGWNPHVGFLSGWVLLLDYVLIPTVTSVSAASYLEQFFPQISFSVWLLIFAIATGVLNLFGVELMAKLGIWMLVLGEAVVFIGFAVWGYAVQTHGVGTGTLFSAEPFQFTNIGTLASATSLAVISYLGFDAITTMAEETKNPKRDVPRAIYATIIVGLFTMCMTGYLGMLVIPNWRDLLAQTGWDATILFHIGEMTGGYWFSILYASGLVVAMAVFNVVGIAAGGRLLFGMGRDNMLPKSIFARVGKRWKTPYMSICIILALECILGLTLSLDKLGTLVNYGALFGFAALNLGVISLYYIKKKGEAPASLGGEANWVPTAKYFPRYFLAPLVGFLIVLWVFSSLDKLALTAGTAWLIIGIIYEAIKTKGWKELPPNLDL